VKQKGFKDIALKLQNRLTAEGFVIQRYDAYSTNSIYLKLDYGMCNSIRISDHAGKKHLNYMFNLGKHITAISHDKQDFTRYYYPLDKMDELVRHILKHRQGKMQHYGASYYEAMEEMRMKNQNNTGFWSKAYLVNDAELRRRFEAAFTVV